VPSHPPHPARDLDLTTHHDEQIVVARVREGDPLALEMIFLAFYAELLALAEQVSGSRETAEEAIQDVFLTIWRARTGWHVSRSLRGYLRRAIRNAAVRAARASDHSGGFGPHAAADDRSVDALPDGRPTPADQATYHELADAAAEATQALPPRARDVFLLRRDEALSNREIARRLGVSVKTVETHMSRALRFLRRRLARWLDDGGGPPARR
jgi:RNA polymerase sigma-19 factor, ECF subfamily